MRTREQIPKTSAQISRGHTALAASSGTWFFIWALSNFAAGTPHSWASTPPIAVAMIVAGNIIWLLLNTARANPRVIRHASGAAYNG